MTRLQHMRLCMEIGFAAGRGDRDRICRLLNDPLPTLEHYSDAQAMRGLDRLLADLASESGRGRDVLDGAEGDANGVDG